MTSKTRALVELMRWHRPTGTVLTLTPSLWSVTMFTPATCAIPDPTILGIFTAGAVVARGMGCTINDILDRNIDKHVERTKMRPIASGALSVKEGVASLVVQSTVGLGVLCLNNPAVIKLGLLSGLLISTYPLFKRFTFWPQTMLAFTINWGVLMGYAAVNGSISINEFQAFMPLYMGSIFWTLYYDTIYAHQDKTDDAFIGVKSSALILGSGTKNFLNAMTFGMSSSLAIAGFMTGQLWPYYFSVASVGVYNSNLIRKLDLDHGESCWKAFDRQKYVGLAILAGTLASLSLKHKKEKLVRINKSKD